ncbi:MAG TPA: hypothetical protein VLB11_03680 [Methyloceanibacter sp.]|nr:hypothetical protein [Methyloceanibacter sp.]
MTRPIALLMTSAILLGMSSRVSLAANAVTTAPANIHANRTELSTVIGTIRAAEPVQATNCRNGWCAAAGGYVRSSKLRFARAGQGARKARRDNESYDYNVPLALPPYGYSPSFWGYGGRRYYDKYGNYRKFGQQP